ncbi:hypothetical protein BC828DRAFT_382372, partial [Blastocladiella britannica]
MARCGVVVLCSGGSKGVGASGCPVVMHVGCAAVRGLSTIDGRVWCHQHLYQRPSLLVPVAHPFAAPIALPLRVLAKLPSPPPTASLPAAASPPVPRALPPGVFYPSQPWGTYFPSPVDLCRPIAEPAQREFKSFAAAPFPPPIAAASSSAGAAPTESHLPNMYGAPGSRAAALGIFASMPPLPYPVGPGNGRTL